MNHLVNAIEGQRCFATHEAPVGLDLVSHASLVSVMAPRVPLDAPRWPELVWPGQFRIGGVEELWAAPLTCRIPGMVVCPPARATQMGNGSL